MLSLFKIYTFSKQTLLLRPTRVDGTAQMLIGLFGHFAPTRGAADKAFLDEERFVDFLHSSSILANGCGYRADTHRATLELINDGEEYLIVDFVQAVFVDI